MMYYVETFEKALPDMEWLFSLHDEELNFHHDELGPIDLDIESYLSAKNLVVITARDDDKIVGYHWSFLVHPTHYKTKLFAMTDHFYLHPDYRKGFNGINFLKFIEKTLTKVADKLYIQSTMDYKLNSVFEKLGWKKVNEIYEV